MIAGWLARLAAASRASAPARPLRVGFDVDGVLASTAWERAPWTVSNGWEACDPLDPSALGALVAHLHDGSWEAYAITARPPGPGRTVQVQTRRWLQRHGAADLSVVLDPGNRAALVAALDLDWLVDDCLDNCSVAALETRARVIWIAPEPPPDALRQAGASGCVHAPGVAEAIALIERP